jgi:hypothetical protein
MRVLIRSVASRFLGHAGVFPAHEYQYTVCHGGRSAGRYRQGQSDRTTYKMALTASRRGCFESKLTKQRTSAPARIDDRSASATRVSQAAACNCRKCPWVKVRRNEPSVDVAQTPVNSDGSPPWRRRRDRRCCPRRRASPSRSWRPCPLGLTRCHRATGPGRRPQHAARPRPPNASPARGRHTTTQPRLRPGAAACPLTQHFRSRVIALSGSGWSRR